MLRALMLKLQAEGPVELPRTHGHQAHALFLRLIETADPGLARELHDPQRRKPFTVSSAQARAGPEASAARGRAGTTLWLRVTLLEDALFGPFIERFLRPGAPAIRLGSVTLRVEEVIGTREGHPLAGYSDFADLLAAPGDARSIDLHFASPTAFSLGQSAGGKKRMGVLPEPQLVFDSLLRKWNQFAPADMVLDAGWRAAIEESCVVAQHELRTAMFQFPRHLQIGFVGRCRFAATSDDPEYRRVLSALACFAFYAGVGYKTTMGMGQVRRLPVPTGPER